MKVGKSAWSLRVSRPGSPDRVFPISVNWSFEGKEGHAHAFVGRNGDGVAEFGAPIVIERRAYNGDIFRVFVGDYHRGGLGSSVKSAVEDWASRMAGLVANGSA